MQKRALMEVSQMKGWLALALALTFITSSFAQQTPSDVAFSGEHFFRFRVSAGKLSPEERAIALHSRLTQVFTKLLGHGVPLSVQVRSLGAMKTILVAGVPFVTVTQADADANQTTIEQLTEIWAGNLERGIRAILHGQSSKASMAVCK